MGRLITALSWSLVPISAVVSAADTIRVAWNRNKFGPDGPWQALDVAVGKSSEGNGALQPMWPSLYWINNVLTPAAGGNYVATTNTSDFARQTGIYVYDASLWRFEGADTYPGNPDKQEKLGDVVFDIINPGGPSTTSAVNTTIWALKYWFYSLPMYQADGTGNYSAQVGTLGLGKQGGTDTYAIDGQVPATLLGSLKSQGAISSEGFGLHIGSVALQQPGSCILGGYEQHRALGRVGVFDYDMSYAWPVQHSIEVVDLVLGTQIGSSPFSNGVQDEGSIWSRGFNTADAGAGNESARYYASPSLESPYIYMPPGACEVLAARLPVTYEQTLKLWLWNTDANTTSSSSSSSSPSAAERLTRSSAYLAFVLRDRTQTNITIKVPFRLLNLTLEPPLVSKHTAYFPCKSTMASWGDNTFILGRAFFQAAFIAADLARNHVYLAQAPGPDTTASLHRDIVRTFNPPIEDQTGGPSQPGSPRPRRMHLPTNPIEEFDMSWSSSWVILNGDDQAGPGGNSTASGGENMTAPGDGKISRGGIVGISLAAIVVLGLAVVVAWMKYYSPSRRRARRESRAGTVHLELPVDSETKTGKVDGRFELDTEMRAEMDGTWVVIHEAPEGGEVALRYAELPGKSCWSTLTSSPETNHDKNTDSTERTDASPDQATQVAKIE